MLNIKKITALLMTAVICLGCVGCEKKSDGTQDNSSTSKNDSVSVSGKVELKDYAYPEFLKNLKSPDMLTNVKYSSFNEADFVKEIETQPFDNYDCISLLDGKFYTFKDGKHMGLLDLNGKVIIEADTYVSITPCAKGMLKLSYDSELKAKDEYASYTQNGEVKVITDYSFSQDNINIMDNPDYSSEQNKKKTYMLTLSDGTRITDSDGNYLWDSVEQQDMDSIVTTKVYKAYYKVSREGAYYYVCFDSLYNYTIYEGAYANVKLKVGNVIGECYIMSYDDYTELNKMVTSFGNVNSTITPSRDETLDYIQITFGINSPDQVMMTISSDGFCLTDSLTHNNQPDNKYFSCLDKDSFVSLILWVDQVLSQEYADVG